MFMILFWKYKSNFGHIM
jgi:hypothetical protein